MNNRYHHKWSKCLKLKNHDFGEQLMSKCKRIYILHFSTKLLQLQISIGIIHFGSFFVFINRNSISKNVLIFESCTSFIIISLARSVPFRSFDVSSSAYWIQTQFAQPDIQQLFGGVGIYMIQIEIGIFKNFEHNVFCSMHAI